MIRNLDMNDVCVLIRVYNRVEDLKYCVDIIRDTWKEFTYHIILVANGTDDGYIIDDETIAKVDQLIILEKNIGHFNGNSQLLLSGLPSIPDICKYTLILEADTWLYEDDLIKKYIKLLDINNAVWASAQFFRYVLNLATDIALVNTSFLKAHSEIFSFTGTPEYYVANYLKNKGFNFLYIKENMPVSLPRYFRRYPYASKGRFFAFEKSKMVTHHIENLPGGMEEKKFLFNVVANSAYFKVQINRSYRFERFKMRFFMLLSTLLPYKGWFIKTKNS